MSHRFQRSRGSDFRGHTPVFPEGEDEGLGSVMVAIILRGHSWVHRQRKTRALREHTLLPEMHRVTLLPAPFQVTLMAGNHRLDGFAQQLFIVTRAQNLGERKLYPKIWDPACTDPCHLGRTRVCAKCRRTETRSSSGGSALREYGISKVAATLFPPIWRRLARGYTLSCLFTLLNRILIHIHQPLELLTQV